MNNETIEAAIAYWENCRNKGTAGQRKMVEETIKELKARLEVTQ